MLAARRQEACALNFLSEGLIVVCQQGRWSVFFLAHSLSFILLPLSPSPQTLPSVLTLLNVIHICTLRPSKGGVRIDRESAGGERGLQIET